MTEAAAGTLEITFVPDLAEHLRARRAMARLTPIGDVDGALAWFLALTLLWGFIVEVGFGETTWGPLGVLPPALFFLGVGIAMRRGFGRALTWAVDDEGVEVRQPRHRVRVGRERIRRAAETEEFFLIVSSKAVFYLPKRALGTPEAGADLRARLGLAQVGGEDS